MFAAPTAARADALLAATGLARVESPHVGCGIPHPVNTGTRRSARCLLMPAVAVIDTRSWQPDIARSRAAPRPPSAGYGCRAGAVSRKCGVLERLSPVQRTVEDQPVALVVIDHGTAFVRVVVQALHDATTTGLDGWNGAQNMSDEPRRGWRGRLRAMPTELRRAADPSWGPESHRQSGRWIAWQIRLFRGLRRDRHGRDRMPRHRRGRACRPTCG